MRPTVLLVATLKTIPYLLVDYLATEEVVEVVTERVPREVLKCLVIRPT